MNNGGDVVDSCAVSSANGFLEMIRLEDQVAASSCHGGPAFTCTDHVPWIEDGTLYGYVANQDTGDKSDCGTCFELEIEGAANGINRAVVQVSNKGGMGSDGSKKAVFDLLVPGGGFGDFTGCQDVPGWNVYTSTGGPCDPTMDTEDCWRYGGFGDVDHCTTAFPGDLVAQRSCLEVLWGIFPKAWETSGPVFRGNVDVTRRRVVDCPVALTEKSGVSGEGNGRTNDWVQTSTTVFGNSSFVAAGAAVVLPLTLIAGLAYRRCRRNSASSLDTRQATVADASKPTVAVERSGEQMEEGVQLGQGTQQHVASLVHAQI